MISCHLSSAAADNLSPLATHIFPLNCSGGGLSSIKKRCDNSMHFARQDSRSQGSFMRQASTQQDSDQSSVPFKSTGSGKQESPELMTPLFSQPASVNSNFPKVRNIHYAVDECKLPTSLPPKYSRTTLARDAPMKFIPKNNTYATKRRGMEKKVTPRMDVAESGGKYILLIELPGFSINDIRVEVDNTTLTVGTTKGRTTASSLGDQTSSSYYKREIREGPFEISWPLPFNVNPDSVSAEFLDGLLRITINKLRVPAW